MIRLIIFCFLTFILFSFSIERKSFKPPGTVKINDTLYLDETEVSNFSWREFEYWTAVRYGKNSDEYKFVLPDTLVWMNSRFKNEAMSNLYHWHPAFRDYPVVGISYEQAVAYCKWRTGRVKEYMLRSGKYKNLELTYRLPDEKEWMSATFNGQFEFSNNGRDQKNRFKFNAFFPPQETTGEAFHTADHDFTAPVYAYWQNVYGVYNMIGNVAEMIQEKGKAKGGSWQDPPDSCRVGKQQSYTSPSAWLGFRCVCIVRNIAS